MSVLKTDCIYLGNCQRLTIFFFLKGENPMKIKYELECPDDTLWASLWKKVGFNVVNFQNYPDSGIKGGPWVPEWTPLHVINIHLNFSRPITWFPIKVSHWDGESSHSVLVWSTKQVCWENPNAFRNKYSYKPHLLDPRPEEAGQRPPTTSRGRNAFLSLLEKYKGNPVMNGACTVPRNPKTFSTRVLNATRSTKCSS